MEQFLNNQQIPLVQVIDPNTGQQYYAPAATVYNDRNGPNPTLLDGITVDQATSASYALTASFALNGGGGSGTQGATGAQGIQGRQGITGAGTQGTTGAQGTTGVQGAVGTQGTTGAQGAMGAQGTTGTNGLQGATGAQGTVGTQGTTGSQGITGTQGTVGAQGTTGTQGTAGTNGTQGTTGAQGITGAQGTTGTQGVQGIQGSTGVLPGGTRDYISKFTGTTTLGNSIIFESSSNIGINTITPNSGTLHVGGNVFATSFTGSFLGTASYAIYSANSDRAISASYAAVATSASYATTASIIPSYEGAWISYTPVWTANSVNPVIGNGTITGQYKLIGKTCFVRGNIVMGSTTTFGSGEWYVSMPFTASHADAILMTANLLDNGSAWYNAVLNGARAGFNFKTAIQYQSTGGTALDVRSNQPFTWASTDRFIWNGSFEIA